MRWLVSSHYSAPVSFSSNDAENFKRTISKRDWAPGNGNWKFLDWLDKKLLQLKVVPKDPLKAFKS